MNVALMSTGAGIAVIMGIMNVYLNEIDSFKFVLIVCGCQGFCWRERATSCAVSIGIGDCTSTKELNVIETY